MSNSKEEIKEVSEEPLLRNECETCGKVFQHASSLSRHRQTHRKSLTFVCYECGLQFTRKDSLQKHQKKCSVKATVWNCEQCSRTYHHKTSYTRHMKIHVKGKVSPSGNKLRSEEMDWEIHPVFTDSEDESEHNALMNTISQLVLKL